MQHARCASNGCVGYPLGMVARGHRSQASARSVPSLAGFLLVLSACGSPGKAASAPEGPPGVEEADIAKEPAPTAPVPASPGSVQVVQPAPIELLGGHLYDGYVVGGLPTRAHIDGALQAGFESALSLMEDSEPGIAEIAPYGARQGLRYLRFVVRGQEDLGEAAAWEFAATLAMLDRPAIVHCATGRRAAALFALKAHFVDEMPVDQAIALGEALGMGELREHVRAVLAASTTP